MNPIFRTTQVNIRFPEGTDYRYGFNIVDSQGRPVNLNGASLLFAVYVPSAPTAGISTVLIPKKTIGVGVTVLDVLLGKTMVTFLHGETTDLAGVYRWEYQLTEANGDVYLAGYGGMVLFPSRRLDRG